MISKPFHVFLRRVINYKQKGKKEKGKEAMVYVFDKKGKCQAKKEDL